ncbi:hypothetical protein G9F73_016460 [Clostridium estertheticum]|uniref:hypothetical protein n=1 Tax=Clostridium estertheticum TaxID=238834 RepID=UPI0013EE4D34|nr:hypothetical protein [Clostridium estertheticum]MBZ9609383.1 hypothetical protein [Clostridium estertheticum]
MKNQKQGDSLIIGAGVWSVLFIGMGIFDLVTKKEWLLVRIFIRRPIFYLSYLSIMEDKRQHK